MANNISTYPYFSDGEVLTAENLNSTVRYLADQPKSICRKLVGVGIIDGLAVQWSDGTLKISPGTAVFPDGTVLDVSEELTYPYVYETDGDIVFSAKELPAEKKYKLKSLDGYGIVLVRDEKSSRTVCNQISCDLNHCQTSEVIEPRLVKKDSLLTYSRKIQAAGSDVVFEPLSELFANMNYSGLMTKVSSCFNANRDILCSAMVSALEGFGIYFSTYGATDDQYIQDWDRCSFWMESVAKGWKAAVHNYTCALTKLHMLNRRGKGTVVVPYYFLDFLQDVREAYLEFRAYSKCFAKKYGAVYDASVLKDNELVISGGEEFVQAFRSVACEKAKADDAEILARFLNRISFMVTGFIGFSIDRSFKASNVRVLPFRAGDRLSDRPIPFYYKKDTELKDFWRPEKPWEDCAPLSYHDMAGGESAALRNAAGAGMQFSIQGAYDMKVSTAETAVKEIISKYGLPINVERLELKNIVMHNDSRRPKEGKNYYRTVLSWLNEDELNSLKSFDIEKVPDPAQCTHRTEKHANERKKTMETKKTLLSISALGTLKTILENADKNTANSSSDMIALSESISKVGPHDFKLLVKYWKDIKLRNMFFNKKNPVYSESKTKLITWKNRDIAAFSKFRDFVLSAFRPEYRYSSTRGVKEFGTVTLVHYKGKVVFPLYSDCRDK